MPQEIDKFVAPRYRSAGRRPEAQQDRRAAADAPLALLRGMLSGVAGAPGDLESFVRMLPGLSEKTILPTSEDVERALPLRAASDTPVGRAATGIGQIGGGFYTGPGSPLRAVAALPSAVRKAGRDFAAASGQPTANVIKQKGGNWLAGSVEDALGSLKRSGRAGNPLTFDAVQADPGADALNNWIDKQLTRYVKNEMATPEDPVRALAERGVLHVDPGELNFQLPMHGRYMQPGQTALAQSDTAKTWEGAADIKVANDSAADVLAARNRDYSTANPWLLKVPPETRVHGITESHLAPDLGFNHLLDELRNATDPNSGLPRELLLKYDALDKVSVPQAVERVAKINEWRAAQKAEADMARANNAASVLHKDYPDKGFKWVELKKQDLPEGWSQEGSAYVDPANPSKWVYPEQSLEDALKYEGETMGHCVGGYCPDVIEGKSRIFSLRDAKGQPHTTIEVQPGITPPPGSVRWQDLSDEMRADQTSRGLAPSERELINTYFDPQKGTRHLKYDPRIVQIKGKSNRAPNPEYLPYVQDFVKSGQWSDVGDLGNAGLIKVDPASDIAASFGKIGKNPPAHVTQDELTELLRWNRGEGELPTGYATGGIVQGAYDPSRIDALATELAKELAF